MSGGDSSHPAWDERPRPLIEAIIQIHSRRVSEDDLRTMLSRSPRDAARWIEAAAKAGLAPAQVVWGQLLLDGQGVARDAGAAFRWFEKAGAQGDVEARNMIGRCYEEGWGVAADAKRAIEAFEIAAKAGHLWAQVNLAQMLVRAGAPGDRSRCLELFKAAAEGGTGEPSLKAMNWLARFLEEGWAGPADPAAALYWYLKAARLGDHWAQYNLATILYRHGDVGRADQWLRRAISAGDNGFRRRIAPLLLTQQDLLLRQRGLDALEHVAEAGAPDDLYAYGAALDEGVAGRSDPEKAKALFKRAAAKGHAKALRRSGRMRGLRKAFRTVESVRAIVSRLSIRTSAVRTSPHSREQP